MEKELARKLHGILTPGSGNQDVKGDVHSELFIAEAKWRQGVYKDRVFATLERKWLEVITRHANRYKKEPLLVINIANYHEYYLVRYEYWLESKDRLVVQTATTLDLSEQKQLRMYAEDDYAYYIFNFGDAGNWILLPESDFLFLIPKRSDSKEVTCKKPARSRPKTKSQLDWESKFKEKQRQLRKELYRKRKKAS